jgi:hypothetical protein
MWEFSFFVYSVVVFRGVLSFSSCRVVYGYVGLQWVPV